MQFAIKCETFVRLNSVLQQIKPANEHLRSIYIECKSGNLIAVATNGTIAAIELLGQVSAPDAHMHLSVDPLLIAQASQEAPLGGSLHVVFTAMLNHAAVKSTFGYQFAGNGAVFPTNDIVRKWRGIIDKIETPSPMIINAESIANLGYASPSGSLVFPEVIDGSKPVVVRDLHDPNWFGLFLPTFFDEGKRIKRNAATYPEWAL